MSEELNYETAYAELKGILNDLQNDDVTVDELTAKVKRAKLLLDFCQKKLADVDADVRDILEELQSDEED